MKKRMIAFLCALLTAIAAVSAVAEEPALRGWNKADKYQYVSFGNYPKAKDGTVAPVIWRVLYVNDDGTALLLTNQVIDGYPYKYLDPSINLNTYKGYTRMTWETSDLRVWMQEEMLPTLLTEEEQSVLADRDGNRIFILTREDYLTPEYGFSESVFGTVSTRICDRTAYARSKGVYQEGKGATYWTATVVPEEDERPYVQIVGYDGHMSYAAYGRRNVGVRPALLVRVADVRLTTGSGTAKDPYVMEPVR